MNTYEKNKMISLLYRIFQAEEYQWQGKVPTFDEIFSTVEDLEQSAIKYKGFTETGRIKVVYDKETQSFEYYLNVGGN